jgi:hypothetical protein
VLGLLLGILVQSLALYGIGSLLAMWRTVHTGYPRRREGVGEKNPFFSGSRVAAEKIAGKDNMSPGSNEQMFGKKEQVPDGAKANRSGESFCTGEKQ